MIDWNDPAARAALAERLGPDAYNRAHAEHMRSSILATVNGHDIRPVGSAFGRLFAVGATRRAFSTLEQAYTFAASTPATA